MLMKSDSATLLLNQFGTEPNKSHREIAFEGLRAMKFKDIYEAGERLVAVLPLETPDLILAVVPNGVPVAGAVSIAKSVPVRGIEFDRESGAIELKLDRVDQAAEIWVVDDGVESGRAATAIGQHLKSLGFTNVSLVVPVCAKDAIAQLQFVYRRVIAAYSPLMTRSLSWHYEQMPAVDKSTAVQMLAEMA